VALDEQLVRLARQTLSQAAESNNASNINDGEAAKKNKQLETLRDAMRNWQNTFDVTLFILRTCKTQR
jgi:hypothetical protein